MLGKAILLRIHARLARLLAPPAGPLVPLVVDGDRAGLLDAGRARRVLAFGDVFRARNGGIEFVAALATPALRSAALARVARTLADEGALTAWRDERYAVAPTAATPALFHLERAAARYFGIRTWAAHANGFVGAGSSARMWIARRSARKAIDPGQLDNLVGGGIAAGMNAGTTLVKEAWEEAGIPATLAGSASESATLRIFRAVPDGLQRETIFACDLALPSDFVPANQDGEVSEFRLVTLDAAAELVALDAGPDQVTADASLVILDCLLRHGAIAGDEPLRAELERLGNRSA